MYHAFNILTENENESGHHKINSVIVFFFLIFLEKKKIKVHRHHELIP